jgi:putative thioredoxin
MSKEVFVFEVSQKSFGQSVLLNSHKIPVLVEFMGVWSGPCVNVAEMFSKLAKEFAEEFIFAKVDIDEQPDLGKEYSIENVPTLIVFKDGEAIRTEVGELQEIEARSLLKDLGIYHESDVMREQARDKHLAGDTQAAIVLLSEAIKKDPANTRVAMDMVQIFIDIDEIEQARGLYNRLPETDKQSDMGKALNGQLTFIDLASKTEGVETLTQKLATNPDDYDARFDIAICLVSQYQYQEAMDHLFYIMENDAEYKDGAVKEMIITITNMIAPVDMELSREFRRRLSSLLSG